MDFGFINGGGECGALIRSIDWSKNPLGPINQWPQSLRTTLSILLNSKFPMFLFWSEDFICFYNDAYRQSLGENGKHPRAMGQKGEECWYEIWEKIGPMLNNVLYKGESTWAEDMLLPIYRNSKIEDVYWTFSYSPIKDESDKPAGVFVAVTETTDKLKTIEKINESKEELEFAINAADLGTWDLNPITNKFTCNDRLRDWFGFPPDIDVDLNSALNCIKDDDREKVEIAIKKALVYETGGNYSVQYTFKNALTNKERVVNAKGKALFNENKQAYRLNGTLQDITEEIDAQNALKKSQENFKNLILQAPIGMIILEGENLIIELVNSSYLNLTGKTEVDFIDKPLWEALPEAKSLGFNRILKKVMQTGIAHYGNEQAMSVFKNGKQETAYINFVYEPLKDPDGSINRIMVIAIDVTDILESTHKIQDAEERVRLATEAVGLGTFDLNLVTGKIKTSERFNQIFGFKNNVSRSKYSSLVHPDDSQIRIDAHKRALDTGQIFYEVRIIPNNTVRWIRVEGKVYYNADNKAIRMLGTVIDITDQRKAKQDLEQINQQLEIALEAGNIGAYTVNLITRKVNFSDQFVKNYGTLVKKSISYDDLLNLIEPNFKNDVITAVNTAILNRTTYHAEFQILWSDGSIHWIKESGKAQYDEKGNAISFIAVSLDITENKQLQQQKDDFIGIASHELKTPVTSIKAYAQVLERILLKKGDVMAAGFMTKMDNQLNRLTNLIGDLLDVTKVNSGKLQYNHTNFDFNGMIKSAVEELQRTTESHTILEDLTEVGSVFADKERISQVITNLVTNAVKYSPNSTKIVIHTRLEDNNIVVCVEDFGIGIAEDKLNKVFEQFYRVSGSMQHTFPGLGLGLYISSEIIKREGGKIWVNSIEGKGSNFCFSIPRNKTEKLL